MAGFALGGDIQKLIQSKYLKQEFQDCLLPTTLFRRECIREEHQAGQGQTLTMTRRALVEPDDAEVTPGGDPTIITPGQEQWTVTFELLAKSAETHMPTSFASLANLFMADAKSLSRNAGWQLDRKARNATFAPYAGGRTFTSAAVAALTTIPVTSCSGFAGYTDNLGNPVAVSAATPISVLVNGVANFVTGCAPDDAKKPWGPGVLTLAAAVTVGARVAVLALNAPFMSFPSAVTSIDGLTSSTPLTWTQVQQMRAKLSNNRVPKFPDGTYHLHVTPDGAGQLLHDSRVVTLYQGKPDSDEMRMGMVARQFGVTVIENEELPRVGRVTAGSVKTYGAVKVAPEVGLDITNTNGLEVQYCIMLGDRAISEFYVSEAKVLAQMVPQNLMGYVGGFTNEGGFMAIMDGIRHTVRPAMDPLLYKPMQSWSAIVGFVAPSDALSLTSAANFKRAVVGTHCPA